MSGLKAIETRYHGYRFRSRLEARWAVFLNTLGIRWEYEKEGYELPSGRYLPDFWLPTVYGQYETEGLWLEIKGQAPTQREKDLCAELAEATDQAVVLFPVLPGHFPYGEPKWLPGACQENCQCRFLHCTACNSVTIGVTFECMCCYGEAMPGTPLIRIAESAATQARFEHGEHP